MSSYSSTTVARPAVRITRSAERATRIDQTVQRRSKELIRKAASTDRAAPTRRAELVDSEATVVAMQATVEELRAEQETHGVEVDAIARLDELARAAAAGLTHDRPAAVDIAWAQFETGRERVEQELDRALDDKDLLTHTAEAVTALMGDAGMVPVGGATRRGDQHVVLFEDLGRTQRVEARLDPADGAVSISYCGDDGGSVAPLLLERRFDELHRGREHHGVTFEPVQQAQLHIHHTRREAAHDHHQGADLPPEAHR
jgi:hypothetical protein